tara:strand:+ start:919 stop:1113 length:195 start_codon:yes stop_codon:yes gene_type:complete
MSIKSTDLTKDNTISYFTNEITSEEIKVNDEEAGILRFSSRGAFNIRGQTTTGAYKTFIGEQKS